MPERVVLTGATSFLGRNLLKGLLDKSYEVYALVREGSKDLRKISKHPNLQLIYGDLDTIESICEYVNNADVFIHFAWDGSGNIGRANSNIQGRNVDYSKRALAVAKKLACKLFLFSGSQAEYGIYSSVMYEDILCSPKSEYGKAKLLFSQYAKDYCKLNGMIFYHLRIFSVYGPDDRKGTLIDSCVKGFNGGLDVKLGACLQNWNYLFIDDFVNIIIRMLESSCDSGIYNIASNDTRELRNFVQEIYKLSNKSGKYSFGDGVTNPEGSPSLSPSISKVMDGVGGYTFISFEEGIKRIMEKN